MRQERGKEGSERKGERKVVVGWKKITCGRRELQVNGRVKQKDRVRKVFSTLVTIHSVYVPFLMTGYL